MKSAPHAQILTSITAVCRFEGLSGMVQFDERGDADGRYQIDQLQKIGKQYIVKTVGFWYKSTMSLELTEDIYWNVAHNEGEVPESLCSKPCAPGQYYVQLELRWVTCNNYLLSN